MTDPAVAFLPGEGYGPFDRGDKDDVWLKAANNSSPFLGAVWPGVTVFPGAPHTESFQPIGTDVKRNFRLVPL